MEDPREELIREILSTFTDRSFGKEGIALWEDWVGEEAAIADQLRERSWKCLSDYEVSQVPLCFLTDAALATILPAAMLAMLRSDSNDFRIAEMLFDPQTSNIEHIAAVVTLLRPVERRVLLKYLQYACAKGDPRGCAAAEYIGHRWT